MFDAYRALSKECQWQEDELLEFNREEKMKVTIGFLICYDRDPNKCAYKVIHCLASIAREIPTISDVNSLAIGRLKLNERFDKKEHFDHCLVNQLKKFRKWFNRYKVGNNHIIYSPDAFDLFLDRFINNDDLIMYAQNPRHRQKISIREVKFVLHRLTIKLFDSGEYVYLSRNYFLAMAGKREIKRAVRRRGGSSKYAGTGKYETVGNDQYYKYTKRRLNRDKIAFMNRLLSEKRFLDIQFNRNKPNGYKLALKNPFYWLYREEG